MSADLLIQPGQRELTAAQRSAIRSVWTKHAETNPEIARQIAIDDAARQEELVTTLVEAEGKPGAAAKKAPERAVRFTCADEMTMSPVTWLWEDMNAHLGRIPRGKLGLLGGREGIGKSLFALWIAARITRGKLVGYYLGKPQSVAIAATEDDWDDTILPRLTASGADLSRVFRVDVTERGGEGPITLPLDTPRLAEMVKGKQIVFLLLDPFLSRMDAGIDTHKDASSRRGIEPLAQLASETGCAVLGIIHVNKGQSGDPLTSLMASRAFAAVARYVLFCMVDPENPKVRLLGEPKNNVGRADPDLPTMAFEIEEVTVAQSPQGPIKAPKMRWKEDDARVIRDLVRDAAQPEAERKPTGKKAAKVSEVAIVLKDYLKKQGGRENATVAREAVMALGYNKNDVYGARDLLKLVVEKMPDKRKDWVLPSDPEEKE